MPEATIAHSFVAHHQVVNMIAANHGTNGFIKYDNYLHFPTENGQSVRMISRPDEDGPNAANLVDFLNGEGHQRQWRNMLEIPAT